MAQNAAPVEEKKSSSADKEETMDVYIRMNEDHEKDYCFSVAADAPVRDLLKIFDSLPMVLSPSYFYNPRPIGFAVSTEPGFLTSDGALLFNDDAHKDKYLRHIDQDAPIRKAIWEGQLVVPIWEYNYNRFTTVLTLLGGWLYLDLPDHISPTPGIQPTVVLFQLIEHYFPALKDDGPSGFEGIYWQYGFFAFHVIKVLFIFMIFQVGGLNPMSFNPLKRSANKKDVTREQLIEIGWTGSRRATPLEWVEENRKLKIEAAGGIVKAYHAGILEKLRGAGIKLNKGEGWDSPGPDSPDAGKSDPDKFVISESYFRLLYKPLAELVFSESESTETDTTAAIKTFRRIGPTSPPEALVEMYEKRKALEPEKKK